MKKTLCVVLISVLLILIVFGVFVQLKEYISIVEYAEQIVTAEASVDLGSGFQICVSYYRPQKRVCFVGCVDDSNNCAIMYIVHTGLDKTKWKTEQIAKREGSNASSLFSTFGRARWK